MFYNEKNTNQIRLNNFLIKNMTTTNTNLRTLNPYKHWEN